MVEVLHHHRTTGGLWMAGAVNEEDGGAEMVDSEGLLLVQ